jgi:hypothetical protein
VRLDRSSSDRRCTRLEQRRVGSTWGQRAGSAWGGHGLGLRETKWSVPWFDYDESLTC